MNNNKQKDEVSKAKRKWFAIGIPLSILTVGAAAAIPTSILLTQKPQTINAKKYVVSFESNGGTKVNSQEVEENKKAVQPVNPSKIGYIFDKWYTNKECTISFDWNKPISSNTNLYAKFILEEKVITHTINYVNSDETLGSITGELKTTITGDKQFGQINKPTVVANKDVTFLGWYDANDNLLSDETNITSNIDIIAKWKYQPTEFNETVILDSDGKVYKASMTSLTTSTMPIKGTSDDGETKEWDRATFNEKIILASNMTNIPDSFLYNCTSFNQPLVIPNSVTKIGRSFMSWCTSFNQPLVIPNNVVSIDYAFMFKCSSFNQNIVIPDSCETIGLNFLVQCLAFNQRIILPKNLKAIADGFMEGCCSFNQTVVIPTSVTSIGNNFLGGSDDRPMIFNQPISIPNGLTTIGEFFLVNCTSFNQPVMIPNTVTSIGAAFMQKCSSFNQPLILSSELATINNWFLNKCSSFNQPITLPSKIESINYGFMNNCIAYSNEIDLSKLSPSVVWDKGSMLASNTNQITFKVASGTTDQWKTTLGWTESKTNWLFHEN